MQRGRADADAVDDAIHGVRCGDGVLAIGGEPGKRTKLGLAVTATQGYG
jgi:hypothetical protein